MEIRNKVVMITGGIRGIGFATVQHLLRKGAKYVNIIDLLNRNDKPVVDKLKKLDEEFGTEKFGYRNCDVTDFDQFRICFEKLLGKQRYVDILINNADSGNENNIDLIVNVNFKAIVKCSMLALDYMGKHKSGKGGVIVITGSYLGLKNCPLTPLYCATKHAVVSFVRSMKDHNERWGVRIVCLCRGITKRIGPKILESLTYDFANQKVIDWYIHNYHNEPDNVAAAIIGIIERGSNGAVWLVENDEAAVDVEEIDSTETIYVPS